MQAIQLDKKGLEALAWLNALRKLEPHLRAADPQVWTVANNMLRNWNGSFEPDSKFAALFVLLRRELFNAMYADELGDDLEGFMAVNLFAYGALQETVRTGESSFWDDIRTPGKETPVEIWARALRRAARDLQTQQGELSSAQLGRLRRLTFPHAFHSIPLLDRLFRVGPVAIGGDNHTVDAVKTEINTPDTPLFIPTYRVVYTPGDWRRTRGAQPLGQSGHRFVATGAGIGAYLPRSCGNALEISCYNSGTAPQTLVSHAAPCEIQIATGRTPWQSGGKAK
jgi:penicillin amidase